MGYFKNLAIDFMNREAAALDKLYAVQNRFSERVGTETLLLYSSNSAENLLRCIYFWLFFKCHRFREEKYPDRIFWTYKDQEFFIRIIEREVFCGDTEVTSFAEFLEFYDGIKKQKKTSN